MMDERQLPTDLQELEHQLSSQPLPTPTSELRSRVLGKVGVELGQRRKRARWSFAAIALGGALLWLNLSLFATQSTDYTNTAQDDSTTIDAEIAEIQQIIPGTSTEEARRHALLIKAGMNLTPLPHITASPKSQNPKSDKN